jgi:hypothetical protein
MLRVVDHRWAASGLLLLLAAGLSLLALGRRHRPAAEGFA